MILFLFAPIFCISFSPIGTFNSIIPCYLFVHLHAFTITPFVHTRFYLYDFIPFILSLYLSFSFPLSLFVFVSASISSYHSKLFQSHFTKRNGYNTMAKENGVPAMKRNISIHQRAVMKCKEAMATCHQ